MKTGKDHSSGGRREYGRQDRQDRNGQREGGMNNYQKSQKFKKRRDS